MLEARGIIVGKPPGSLTGKSQPCDGFFIAPKTCLRALDDKDVEGNTYMIRVLKEMFHAHEERMARRLNVNIKTVKMAPNHVNMGTLGPLRVQLALQKSMCKNLIIESFHNCGIVVNGECSLVLKLKR